MATRQRYAQQVVRKTDHQGKTTAKLEQVEGIAGVYAAKLRAAGAGSADALLKMGSTPNGRAQIEKTSGIAHSLVLKWVNQCEMYRVKGVGAEYLALLEASVVDTVPELGQRNAAQQCARIAAANARQHCVRQIPAQ
ncbi:MAG: DUF4332 domain-containing protein [Betaproteobacteria bacterium]|nr:DUF4332 domain-containing protein [Betaproteobacteria bacterium]